MITVNGWCAGGMGEGGRIKGGGVRLGTNFVQLFSNLSLKELTEESATTKTGSLFQYLTTLIENADPLLRRWLASWSAL